MRVFSFSAIVANLLIHREYSSAYPAKLIISGDKVVTENGNKARGYGVVNLNDFNPYPKNPVIASVFKEIGWADELGSGVRNIKKYSAIYSGKAPEFEEGDIFRTTIYTTNESEEENSKPEVAGKVAGKVADKVAGKVADKVADKLNETQLVILQMLKEAPELTIPAIMEKLKLSDYGVRKNIKILKDKGYIERIGSNKTGYWKIIK